MLLRIPVIRSFVAAFVFAVFAFSITPKRWLHNVVATHRDGRADRSPASDKDQLSRATINCPCDNFIAEAPFLHQDNVIAVVKSFICLDHQAVPGTGFISSYLFCSGLRGPPAELG
ncbi:MAG: hypothetical protein JO301_00460 [Chitinophagaceae bacterium]|nr:hypothetical protein [Chitinophagaceae bacterium]